MDCLTIACGSSSHRFSVYNQAFAAMASRRTFPGRSYYPENVVLQAPDRRIVRIAQARGVFSYRVQHRLNFARRVGDDAKDLRGGSLQFRRLDKALPRVGDLMSACFELLFEIGASWAGSTSVRPGSAHEMCHPKYHRSTNSQARVSPAVNPEALVMRFLARSGLRPYGAARQFSPSPRREWAGQYHEISEYS